MRFIAIDPGNNSAVAIIDGDELTVFDGSSIPGREDFYYYLRTKGPLTDIIFGIEDVHAVWGARADATFGFGRSLGFWIGVLDTFGITARAIPIKAWQETMTNKPVKPKTKGLTKSEVAKLKREHKKNLKMESFRAASEAFPKVRFPSHDVTDAVNMARWLRHIYTGNTYEKESSKKGRS